MRDCDAKRRESHAGNREPGRPAARRPAARCAPPVTALGALLCLLALLPAAGCGGPASPQTPPVHLRPTPGPDSLVASPMFQIRMVVLSHRQRPDAPIEDIWRLLGTTTVPYEKRALWEINDLRLGDGARLAADRMNTLATETPDRTAQVQMLCARENFDFPIPLGGERDDIDFLWTDAGGRLAGRHFDKAFVQLRCVCRGDPNDPTAARLAIVPEVLYGPEEMHWVQAGSSISQKMVRASFLLTDLAAEVRLAPGRILVIGPRLAAPSGKAAPDLSLGPAIMYERRGPDLWTQTLILTVERVVPGQIPEGASIPLMPGLKPSLPTKSGQPAAPPAPGTPPPEGTQPPATGTPGAQPPAGPPAPPKVRVVTPNIPGLRIMPPTGSTPPPPLPPASPPAK